MPNCFIFYIIIIISIMFKECNYVWGCHGVSVIDPTACLVFSDYKLATMHCTGSHYIALDKGMHCPLLANNHVYEIQICGMLTSSGIKTDDELQGCQTNMQVHCMTEHKVIKYLICSTLQFVHYIYPHRNSAKMLEIVVECICISACSASCGILNVQTSEACRGFFLWVHFWGFGYTGGHKD